MKERIITRSLLCAAALILMGAVSGCVSLGSPVARLPLPAGAPSVKTILTSLAENEAALHSFRASGTFMVQIPEMEAIQVSRESSLLFQAPNYLNIIGRRYGTRGIELTYVDDAFVLEFPTRKEYCFRDQEASFTTLSSTEIVGEMFEPEQWTQLPERRLRMTSFDAESQKVELELWVGGRHPWRKRILLLQGAPWVLLENSLFDEDGTLIAKTTKTAYHEQEGLRYATEIESVFPGEDAWMRFLMRRVEVNPELDPNLFDLAKRVELLRAARYRQVDIFAGEGPSAEELNLNP
ncbi:MAG: hypothetical protein GX117_04750 [Candidatus Hydrogenedentes bacterium]|jgi:hypothetical protein|nr:hypothetical protein [Candidatus Hydrogenedentota bacterium]